MFNPQKSSQNERADTLVLILAGGQGSRLHELTDTRAKPGLEFAANFRIIDFSLSNCINSGLKKIGVLTQYKSRHLLKHLMKSWAGIYPGFGECLEVLPASQQLSQQWYQGTADALFQNAEFIAGSQAKYTLVLAGDHIYKMDYRPFIEQHQRQQADMSLACMVLPTKEAAGKFGIMKVDSRDRIVSFSEKPKIPEAIPCQPDHCLASMGIYVFNTAFLLAQLKEDAVLQSSQHDFGKNIIPRMLSNFHVHAYRFGTDPQQSCTYWQDVGTLDSYWQANMALLTSPHALSLDDSDWPIWSQQTPLSALRFSDCDGQGPAQLKNALIGAGSVLDACYIQRSVVCSKVVIEKNASICDCVILPNAQICQGAIVHRAIIDKACVVPAGLEIGVDLQRDRANGFRVSENGIVLVCQAMLDRLASHKEHRFSLQLSEQNKSLQKEMFASTNEAFEGMIDNEMRRNLQ